jgi:CheY-like chemotaxis protein
MSHEIRTPLNGVLLAAELAAAEDPTPLQKEYLDTIRTSGESLLLLLNDLLDLSKIEAGKMELSSENFSIHNCMAQCIDLLAARAQQKNLRLTVAIGESVPDLICGDSLRLRQILLNLVGNAIKFTDRGSIAVNVECLVQASGEIGCHFSVQDTGIGIPPEKHSLVFREFEQGDDTATTRFGGTGLGLAISGKLTHLLGGKIWLESEVGHGSTFHFTARFMSAIPQPNIVGLSYSEKLEAKRALRILLAEDNPVNQHLALRLLENEGHSVIAVGNGSDAVRAASEQFFDVILMDVHMPEMDGIEATRKIRGVEMSTRMHIPIIAMTANAMTQDREACLAAGMDGYVPKPINLKELLTTLARVINSPAVEQTSDLILAR